MQISFVRHGYSISVWLLLLLITAAISASAQSTFEKLYRTDDYDVTNSLEQTADNGYILVGQSGPVYDTCTSDMILVKCDEDGNVQWSNRYSTIFCDQGWDVKQTTDHGYIVTGLLIDTINNTYMVLLKTDSLGNIVWQKLYNSNLHDEGVSLFLTNDGGYLVSGYRYNQELFGYDLTLTQFDSAGNVIWSKFYLTPGAEYGQIQLFDNGDNTFYMVAVEVNVMSFPIQEDFLVMRVAGDGDVLSCRTYGNAESNEKGWGIIKIDANRYWLIGTGGADNHTDALLVQIDSSGNVMWSKVYDDGTYAADESSVTSYSYIPEYGLFVCGFDAFYNPFTFIIDLSDAFVFHVTDDGDLAWWEDFGTHDAYYWELFQRMEIANDGGLLLAGSRTTYGNYDGSEHWDMYVTKTNALGKNGCELDMDVDVTDFEIDMHDFPVIDSSITLFVQDGNFVAYPAGEEVTLCNGLPTNGPTTFLEDHIRISPNPADDLVEVHGLAGNGLTFRLFDLAGKELMSSPVHDSVFGVSEMPEGICLWQLLSENGQIMHSGKLAIVHAAH